MDRGLAVTDGVLALLSMIERTRLAFEHIGEPASTYIRGLPQCNISRDAPPKHETPPRDPVFAVDNL